MSDKALSDHPVVLTDGEVPGGAVARLLGRSGPLRVAPPRDADGD